MKNRKETRGRPRQFADPCSLTLTTEKTDREQWQKQADASGQSLNQWANRALNSASKTASPQDDLQKPLNINTPK